MAFDNYLKSVIPKFFGDITHIMPIFRITNVIFFEVPKIPSLRNFHTLIFILSNQNIFKRKEMYSARNIEMTIRFFSISSDV